MYIVTDNNCSNQVKSKFILVSLIKWERKDLIWKKCVGPNVAKKN